MGGLLAYRHRGLPRTTLSHKQNSIACIDATAIRSPGCSQGGSKTSNRFLLPQRRHALKRKFKDIARFMWERINYMLWRRKPVPASIHSTIAWSLFGIFIVAQVLFACGPLATFATCTRAPVAEAQLPQAAFLACFALSSSKSVADLDSRSPFSSTPQ